MPSHTDQTVTLSGVARACGLEQVFEIADDAALQHGSSAPLFARVAITAEDTRRVLAPRDGVLLENRFRSAIGAEGS